MSIIKVENLGKKYIIGHDKAASRAYHYYSLRESLMHHARGIYQRLRHPLAPNRENTELEEFWALKDINFEIEQGDRVGIIGRNGAGKSTLLKILSRITEPSTGKVTMHGRVASLLEVGTGFHPELTGRENIYLNGAILGMTRLEIKKKFDEIVAFAEVEKFLDTPVKRYSSGMYVRLAFAVAAHLEPEILLVDEVLAVGDAQFQKKCLGKMEDVSKEGRTVLFVSHNMDAIQTLCNKGVLIDSGKLVLNGTVREVINSYFALNTRHLENTININRTNEPSSPLKILSVTISSKKDCIDSSFFTDGPMYVTMEYEVSQKISNVLLAWSANLSSRLRVFDCRSMESLGLIKEILPGKYKISCKIEHLPLTSGAYNIDVGARCESSSLDYVPCVATFQVSENKEGDEWWYSNSNGIVEIKSEWNIPVRKI